MTGRIDFSARLMHILMMILVPCFIFFTAVRLVINPLYASIEYRMPGFPEDTYGFTLQDRLKWAPYAIDYLVNDAGIEYLGNLTFDDGSALYNERELSHMVDVKDLVQLMIHAWYIVIALILFLSIIAWRFQLWAPYWNGASKGGWVVIGLIALMIFGVFLNFDALFTEFHHLFFTGDTWLFYYSDTLIRLFPMRFWQDAFITVGAFAIIGGLTSAFGFRKLASK